jgi:RNA polymerase sigma-70 factor (family 1)
LPKIFLHKYFSYNDSELCQLLKQDDRAAFELIYERYWQKLYEKANRLLKLSVQAEDIVQELFINLWQKRNEYDIDNLNAYLHTALRSRVLNYIEREQGKEIFFEPFETIQQASFSAEELVREKELMKIIVAYIDSLPAKRKEIFLLHYQQQLATADIAALLGITQKTVQNQLNNAMTGIKGSLSAALIIAILAPH